MDLGNKNEGLFDETSIQRPIQPNQSILINGEMIGDEIPSVDLSGLRASTQALSAPPLTNPVEDWFHLIHYMSKGNICTFYSNQSFRF